MVSQRCRTCTAIATELGVSSREITLFSTSSDETLEKCGLLKLTAIRSAKDLSYLAQSAHDYGYLLKVVPRTETAGEMQELMIIVRRYCRDREGEPDEFDKLPFGDIPRLARLNQLLEKLSAEGVGVLAGTIVITEIDNPEIFRRIPGGGKRVLLFVLFEPIAVEEEVITTEILLDWIVDHL